MFPVQEYQEKKPSLCFSSLYDVIFYVLKAQFESKWGFMFPDVPTTSWVQKYVGYDESYWHIFQPSWAVYPSGGFESARSKVTFVSLWPLKRFLLGLCWREELSVCVDRRKVRDLLAFHQGQAGWWLDKSAKSWRTVESNAVDALEPCHHSEPSHTHTLTWA